MQGYLRYFLFCLVIGLCKLLPGRFLYWIALRIADLNYFVLDPKGREAVKDNLRHVLPDATDERILYEARWVFRNMGKFLTEFFRFRTFDKAFFQKHVAVKGKEWIDEALAREKGCILLSAHLANWELGAGAMHMLCDYKANGIAAMHRYGKVNELFMREREAVGLTIFSMEEAPRKVLRALKNNEVVCIVGDRDPTEHGVLVDFFGRPCRFPQGPARFALKSGAPIIPGFCLRRTNDSFLVDFEPPIYPDDPSTWDRWPKGRPRPAPDPNLNEKQCATQAIVQAYAHVIEEAIRWHPEEWSVFYRVWDEEWDGN